MHARGAVKASNHKGKSEGKGKRHTLDIASFSGGTSLQKRSGMARVVEKFHSFYSLWIEWTIPALTFPAEAGPHLPTTEGWKTELA